MARRIAYLQEMGWYGGALMSRAEILADLDAQGLSLRERDAYMMAWDYRRRQAPPTDAEIQAAQTRAAQMGRA